ncbi:hypothetical protein AY586_14620 [Marichromatium gracile]|uniref:T4 superinfection immunity protein n=2 Tax=Marichromatium gracile TaxID=1048 RepID=A0ABR5VEQ6_MARGR|nr:hypothetical protein AY586_14620 [Marichromatium gracile]
MLLALAFYFLPGLVAKGRRHSKTEAIFVLNLLLGWTFLGWVGALVWAFTEYNHPDDSAAGQPSAASGG